MVQIAVQFTNLGVKCYLPNDERTCKASYGENSAVEQAVIKNSASVLPRLIILNSLTHTHALAHTHFQGATWNVPGMTFTPQCSIIPQCILGRGG